MKKYIAVLILSAMLLGCLPALATTQKHRYEFFDTFDTIITVIGYHNSTEVFEKEAKEVHRLYQLYHKYFDIYNEYEDVLNLASLNRLAAQSPQKVDAPLYDFLRYAKDLQERYPSPVNIAMGNVLKVWHDFRDAALENPSAAATPSLEELQKAAEYTDIQSLRLNDAEKSVFFEQPIRLDAGALAKGYATEMAAQYLEKSELSSFIISAGGNIRTGKQPLDGRAYWGVGIADPQQPNNLYDTVYIRDSSMVTSGDYQRYYEVNGERLHHIIDPASLYPAKLHRSVSIYTKNSAMADYLSTALFILSYEDGLSLLQRVGSAEALWISADGGSHSTPGFAVIQKSQGADSKQNRE